MAPLWPSVSSSSSNQKHYWIRFKNFKMKLFVGYSMLGLKKSKHLMVFLEYWQLIVGFLIFVVAFNFICINRLSLIQFDPLFPFQIHLNIYLLYEQIRFSMNLCDLLPSTHHELKKSLSDFLLSRRSAILSQSFSVLVNYIPFTARSLSLIDKVLFSPIQFQRMFLSWRRGSLFLNSICLCKQRWHRGHINCLPPITLPTRFEISFKEVKCNFTKNFCEIDFY